MGEKMHKVLNVVGAGNIAIGVVILVVGMTTGILAIIAGARLLKEKQNIIF